MAQYVVKEGQSLIDIALQLYGYPEMIVKLCVDNNMNLQFPIVGTYVLYYDGTLAVDDEAVKYYRLNGLDVVTGEITMEDGEMLEHNETEHTFEEHN